MISRRIITGILTAILTLYFSTIVFAHGGDARIELNVMQASPSATIDVRGMGFEQLANIVFTLVNSGNQVQIGEIEADINGDFAFGLLLPSGLTYGEYELRAADAHHTASVSLSIVPDSSGEEGGHRDQEEALGAPMPTFAPGIVPGGVSPGAAQPAPQEAPASNPNSAALVVLGLLVMGVFAALGLRVVRKR